MEQEPTLEACRDALFLDAKTLVGRIQGRDNTGKPKFAETWRIAEDAFEEGVLNYTVRYNIRSPKDSSREMVVIVRADSKGLFNVNTIDHTDNTETLSYVDPSKPGMIIYPDTALGDEASMTFLEQQFQEIKNLEFPPSE